MTANPSPLPEVPHSFREALDIAYSVHDGSSRSLDRIRVLEDTLGPDAVAEVRCLTTARSECMAPLPELAVVERRIELELFCAVRECEHADRIQCLDEADQYARVIGDSFSRMRVSVCRDVLSTDLPPLPRVPRKESEALELALYVMAATRTKREHSFAAKCALRLAEIVDDLPTYFRAKALAEHRCALEARSGTPLPEDRWAETFELALFLGTSPLGRDGLLLHLAELLAHSKHDDARASRAHAISVALDGSVR